MQKRFARVLLVLAALAEIVLVHAGLTRHLFGDLLTLELVCLVPFVLGLWALAHAQLPRGGLLLLIVGVGIAVQCAAVTAPPSSSDDVYRYIWDAKVQLHGVDPYRFAPDAPDVAQLRGRPLFYTGIGHCAWPIGGGICSEVNRPTVRTIYPPVAQAAFDTARFASLARTDSARPLQILAGIAAVSVAGLLAADAARRKRPAWPVALWAWCPVTVFELGNNAHIDGVAVLFSIGGLIAVRERRPALAGGLIAAAMLTKLYPGVLLALALKRRVGRVLAAAAALTALAYLPHVLAVGTDVLGYLPGYLREEDYTNGDRFLLLGVIAPKTGLVVVAGCVVLAGWIVAARRNDPNQPEQTGVWLVGLTLLVSTPNYSWYALLLLALVAMSGRLEWLPLAILPTVAMLASPHVHDPGAFRTGCYAVGLLAVLLGQFVRHSPRLRTRTSRVRTQLSDVRAP